MSHERWTRTLPICGTIIVAAALLSRGGVLSPPAGPVGPTMKTLVEVEPRTAVSATNTPGDANSLFKITRPGSYYLTDNIIGVAGRHGIEIGSSNVTLDLMGFILTGVSGSIDGITAEEVLTKVVVHNGQLRNWGGDGLDLVLVSNGDYENLHANSNGAEGLRIGIASNIRHCTASSNGTLGIRGEDGSTITHCTAISNGESGIFGSMGTTLIGCTSRQNGIYGILVHDGSTVSQCTASLNTSHGIRVAGLGCTVTACTAHDNDGDGFNVDSASTIRNVTADLNNGDGIEVSGRCIVAESSFYTNIQAGIHVISNDNRIESNNLTANARGLDVDAAGNFIVRNTASANTTNFDIVAGNSVGQILNVSGLDITTSNSWRNFEF